MSKRMETRLSTTIKRKRMATSIIERKTAVREAAVHYRHRELIELLEDKTFDFHDFEISDIMRRYIPQVLPGDYDVWDYGWNGRRAALLASYRILLDDGRFASLAGPFAIHQICTDSRDFTDLLHVIFPEGRCASHIDLYENVEEAIQRELIHIVQFMCNLDTFNINRDVGFCYRMRRYDFDFTTSTSRALHLAVKYATRRHWIHSPSPVPRRQLPYMSKIISAILANPKIRPNLRMHCFGPQWRTPIDLADHQYRTLCAKIEEPGSTVVDGKEQLKEAAHTVFLLLSHDGVDIHTIGDA